jgi:hypothetical protein
MKSSKFWLGKLIAVFLIFLTAFPASQSGSAMAQQASQVAPSTQGAASASENPRLAQLDDGEGVLPEAPAPQSPQGATSEQKATAAESGSSQSQRSPHKPVGTAAAPYEPTMGSAASRPAGAAIAPAKQRRVRTILISLGVIAGAGIAIGSVAALSHGSPSRP